MRSLVLVSMLAGCGFEVSGGALDARGGSIDGAVDGTLDDGGTDLDGSMLDGSTADAFRAAVSYVQGTVGVGGASFAVLGLVQPILAGDLCVIGIGVQGGSIVSVNDTGNNQFASQTTTGGQTVYVAKGMHAGAGDTITVTFSGNTGFTAAVAIYRGLDTANPVDSLAAAAGSGTALNSGTASTNHAHDLVVGIASSDGTLAAGAGTTARTAGVYSLIEDREVEAAGSYSALASSGTNVMWTLTVLNLKAAD